MCLCLSLTFEFGPNGYWIGRFRRVKVKVRVCCVCVCVCMCVCVLPSSYLAVSAFLLFSILNPTLPINL